MLLSSIVLDLGRVKLGSAMQRKAAETRDLRLHPQIHMHFYHILPFQVLIFTVACIVFISTFFFCISAPSIALLANPKMTFGLLTLWVASNFPRCRRLTTWARGWVMILLDRNSLAGYATAPDQPNPTGSHASNPAAVPLTGQRVRRWGQNLPLWK